MTKPFGIKGVKPVIGNTTQGFGVKRSDTLKKEGPITRQPLRPPPMPSSKKPPVTAKTVAKIEGEKGRIA